MTPIYLIRHGQTEANLHHLYCGSTDLPLCPAGIRTLQGLHYRLPPVRFVTSGMKRTEQTLALLFGDVPHGQNAAFREIDFGKFEMHSYDQLKDDPDYIAWISGDNERNVPPGGECGEEMTRRVLAAFRQLQRENIPTALITHGGVIAAIMEHEFPDEKKSRYQWQPEPGHGYEICGTEYRPILPL